MPDKLPEPAGAVDEPGPDEWGLECVDRICQLADALRGRMSELLDPFGLTPSRYEVLGTLSKAGITGCSQADVAAALHQSESNICTVIERLQTEGQVFRWQAESDRRKRLLTLSPQGRELVRRVEQARLSWVHKLLGSIGSTDIERLNELLTNLQCVMEPPRVISMVEAARKPGSRRRAGVAGEVPAAKDGEESPGGNSTSELSDENSPQAAIARLIELLRESRAC